MTTDELTHYAMTPEAQALWSAALAREVGKLPVRVIVLGGAGIGPGLKHLLEHGIPDFEVLTERDVYLTGEVGRIEGPRISTRPYGSFDDMLAEAGSARRKAQERWIARKWAAYSAAAHRKWLDAIRRKQGGY